MQLNDPSRRADTAMAGTRSGVRVLRLGVLLAALVAALAIAACGSSKSSSSSTSSSGGSTSASSSTSSSSSSSSDPGVAHAQSVVSKYSSTVSTYDTPTTKVSGAVVKGKTVMYIPLIQQIPAFAITASAMKAALAKLGANLTVCNGQGTPTGAAACISQGVSEHVAAIVTDAIAYGEAANAFKAATAAKIPVLIGDQLPQPGTTDGDLLNYQSGNTNQATLMADWMIADSNGKADAVVGEENEGQSQISYIDNGLVPEFKKYCSGCTYKVIDISLDPTQAASQVNSGLASNPTATYYYGEFEDQLQGAMQGIQQAGKASTIKAAFATATIAGLSKLKANQTIYAEVGDDVNYEGWANVDDVLRMLAKQPVITENIPERIFTRQNIGSITLTNAGQASGEWYGNPATFQAAFLKVWGS